MSASITTPVWLDVRNCDSDPIFNVPGHGKLFSTYSQSSDFTMPESGRIVAGGAHLHGGGLRVDLRNTSCGNRLLFRALASDPGEVRRFYAETVEPLVDHDREYGTDLLSTLEAYLANDCNMNATARAVYAHRHTVAHRLARVRELSGLDAALGEDRERLGLGIKAYRILAPTLPR